MRHLKNLGQHFLYTLLSLLVLIPLLAYANTQYRNLAIFSSTIDSTTIGGTTPAAATISNLKVSGGISNSGSAGIRHFRSISCTTTTGTTGFCAGTTTIPGAPMADNNYSVFCTMDVSATIFIQGVANKTTTSFQHIVVNGNSNTVPASGTLDCLVIHDAT